MVKDMLYLVIKNYDFSKLNRDNKFEVIYSKTANERRTFDFKNLYPFEVPSDLFTPESSIK